MYGFWLRLARFVPPFCLVWGATGCGDDVEVPVTCVDLAGLTTPPDIPLTYATEHLDIHVAESRFLCAGSADDYEQHYRFMDDLLDMPLTRRVPVYIPSTLKGYCGRGAASCVTFDGVVFSFQTHMYHELIHAFACEWRYGSALALTEGLAVAFDKEVLVTRGDPREFLPLGHPEIRGYYPESGHFVRWLIEEYGPEAFRIAYSQSPRLAGPIVVDILSDTYAQDIDRLAENYFDSAAYAYLPLRRCDGVPVLEPSSPQHWEFSTTLDCESSDTYGPWTRADNQKDIIFGADSMYQSVLINIDAEGSYRFQRGVRETGIWIERCTEATSLSEAEVDVLPLLRSMFPTLQGYTDVELTPGIYRLDFLREHGPPVDVHVSIEPAPDN